MDKYNEHHSLVLLPLKLALEVDFHKVLSLMDKHNEHHSFLLQLKPVALAEDIPSGHMVAEGMVVVDSMV
jgi:hypothetical protein